MNRTHVVFQLIPTRERPTSYTSVAARNRAPELRRMGGVSSNVVTLEVRPTGIGLVAASRVLASQDVVIGVVGAVHRGDLSTGSCSGEGGPSCGDGGWSACV
jgi:hypothetical protein